MATILRTNGTEQPLTDLSLAALQAAVGGDIEGTFTHDGRLMYVNEHGKLDGLQLNIEATLLYTYDVSDSIMGDVVVLTAAETKRELEEDADEEASFGPGNPADYGDST